MLHIEARIFAVCAISVPHTRDDDTPRVTAQQTHIRRIRAPRVSTTLCVVGVERVGRTQQSNLPRHNYNQITFDRLASARAETATGNVRAQVVNMLFIRMLYLPAAAAHALNCIIL